MSNGTQIPLYQVDAFTDSPFSGNPAAVCLLSESLPTRTMQAIAAEMNLSETAFVRPPNETGLRRLQWFTPEVEVPLCGHATLATSHVLLREKGTPSPLKYETQSGILTVSEEENGWLRMDFPVDPPTPHPPPEGLLEALGCPTGVEVLLGEKGWVVRMSDEDQVASLNPNFSQLSEVKVGDAPLGVIVTAPGSGGIDFVSRFFGPWVGVDEDPVTGMAHTLLTPYWAQETGSEAMTAAQISPRGGLLRLRMAGDRVLVSGKAVTVFRGTLEI